MALYSLIRLTVLIARQHTAHVLQLCRLEAAHGSARFRSIEAVRESSLEPLADITQDDSACVWSKQWGRRHRRRPAQAAEAVVGRAIVRPPPLGMARHLYRPIARPDCPGLLVSLPVCLRRRRLGGAELGHCQGGGGYLWPCYSACGLWRAEHAVQRIVPGR